MMGATLESLLGLERWGAALGWAVCSFLWQGLLIGLFCAAALRLIPRSSPGARYAVAGGGLALSVLVFCATVVLSGPSSGSGLRGDDAISGLLAEAGYLEADLGAALMAVGATPAAAEMGQRWIPAVAALWALGALWMALRLVFACGAAHRLRVRSRIAVDGRWQAMADRLCVDLGIQRRVRIFATELADSPLVVGWLRPVVLVPTTTFLVLSAEQLRSVLAHELAHIRRFDPLFNALQAMVEVLLFFHPATWWLSSVIRQEREHCCDLAAVRATGGPLPLARALTRLETHRQSSSEVVLAARPKPGFLMTRIQRILDVRSAGQPKRASLRPMTLLGTVAIALGLGIASAAANPQPEAATSTLLSLEGRDAHGDYSIVEARIFEAVEARTLSAADAKNVLKALRESMFDEKVTAKNQPRRRVPLMAPVIGIKEVPIVEESVVRGRRDATLEQAYQRLRRLIEIEETQTAKSSVGGEKRDALRAQREALEARIDEYMQKVESVRRSPSAPRAPRPSRVVEGRLGEMVIELEEAVTDLEGAARPVEISEQKRKFKRGVKVNVDDRNASAEQRAALEEFAEVVRGRLNAEVAEAEVIVEGVEAANVAGKAAGKEAKRLEIRLRELEKKLMQVQKGAGKASRKATGRESAPRGKRDARNVQGSNRGPRGDARSEVRGQRRGKKKAEKQSNAIAPFSETVFRGF